MAREWHDSLRSLRVRPARRAASLALGLLCALLVLAGAATGVLAATINATSLSGGVVVDGVRYARSSNPATSLTVTVATSAGTNCVTISGGVATETLIDAVGRSNWVFSPNATGTNGQVRTITVTAYENWGLISGCTSPAPTSTLSYTADNAAPTTTAAVDGTQVGVIYQDTATVTLTASDPLSGVASTSYTLDGGPATPYSSPIIVDTGGAHTVDYWSVDQLGNTETTKSVSFTIDNNHLAIGPLSDRAFGDPDFTVAATSNASGAITYSATGPCTVDPSSGLVSLTGVGTCEITASQAADATHNADTAADSFEVNLVTGWSPWGSLGGNLTDAPAAAEYGKDLYAFAVGTDQSNPAVHPLYYRTSTDGDAWSGWMPLGGNLTDAPAAATFNGQLYVFARGVDPQQPAVKPLYYRTFDGVSWTNWVSLGGNLTAAPAAAAFNGQLYAFARGVDPQQPGHFPLYAMSSADGASWTAWQDLGGNLSSAPAATAFAGQLHVFAAGVDAQNPSIHPLYAMSSADGASWTAWQSLGGNATAAPAAAAYTPPFGVATLVVLARGSDGALYERRSTDGVGYSGWASLGGQVVGAPAVATFDDQLYAFARWTTNELYVRHTTP